MVTFRSPLALLRLHRIGARSAPPGRQARRDSDGTYRHTFSYGGGGSTIRTDLIDLIEGAESKIFIAAWLIGDEGLLDALSGEPVLTAVNDIAAPDPNANGLIWTGNKEQYILQAIRSIIDSAQSELLLATWCLNGMTTQPDLLLDHLRAAIDRGVEVRMLLRNRHHSNHLADTRTLREMGVLLYPCSLNHAKGAIADLERGALFSANFDADYGLVTDVEVGVRLDHTPALEEAFKFFEHAIAEHDFDLSPSL